MINPRLLITKTLAQSYMQRLDILVPAIWNCDITPVNITGASQDALAIAYGKLLFRLTSGGGLSPQQDRIFCFVSGLNPRYKT